MIRKKTMNVVFLRARQVKTTHYTMQVTQTGFAVYSLPNEAEN